MSDRKIKHISVGKDGSIWAADKVDGTICRLYGDAGALGWVPDKVGKGDIVAAVDWANAWVVNKDHELWRLTGAESLDTGVRGRKSQRTAVGRMPGLLPRLVMAAPGMRRRTVQFFAGRSLGTVRA